MASVVALGGVSFCLFALVLALAFSPIGLTSTSSCNLFSASNCALKFNTNATIVFSSSGYSFYDSGYQTCQQITAGILNKDPILGWLINLPILSNIYDFTASLGGLTGLGIGQTYGGGTINNGANIYATCSQQVGNFLVFHYSGADLITLLIGVILTSAGIAIIAGIALPLVGGGLNPAAVYIGFMISSLGLLWLVLTSFAYPTFVEMPTIIGGTIYMLLTLTYAISILDMIS